MMPAEVSTGLTPPASGIRAVSACCAGTEMPGKARPRASAASAARTPMPPEVVTIARRGPRGNGATLAI